MLFLNKTYYIENNLTSAISYIDFEEECSIKKSQEFEICLIISDISH